MDISELKEYPSVQEHIGEIKDKRKDYVKVTTGDKDHANILRAQGAIEALDWVLDRFEDGGEE